MVNFTTRPVLGDDAVLGLMARVGRHPRVFSNLVQAGFPEAQLTESCREFIRTAESPMDRRAAHRIARGQFDDEDLLALFTRFYDCTDWRLVGGQLFFSQQDYQHLYGELTSPIAFQTRRLEQREGLAQWEALFLRLPFDLAMQRAKTAVWRNGLRRDHYWHPQVSYLDLRAQQIFQYLQQVIDVSCYSKDTFFYRWEREFRTLLEAALQGFHHTLESAVRGWQEDRNRKRARAKYRFEGFRLTAATSAVSVTEALVQLELDTETATVDQMRRSYRRLSKRMHPDQGGSSEAFCRLAACREIAENWLRNQQR